MVNQIKHCCTSRYTFHTYVHNNIQCVKKFCIRSYHRQSITHNCISIASYVRSRTGNLIFKILNEFCHSLVDFAIFRGNVTRLTVQNMADAFSTPWTQHPLQNYILKTFGLFLIHRNSTTMFQNMADAFFIGHFLDDHPKNGRT